MLKVLTEKAGPSCAHGGRVGLEASQDLVRIQGVPALVRPDMLAAIGAGLALAAGLHCSRLDGSEIVYNNPHPYMPDFVICRTEIRDEMMAALDQVW